MSYYGILGLHKEPFSTSPDPAFFFLSRDHRAAFFRLQVSVALKRGLCVVMGDVGTGKTTLSRKLSQALHGEPDLHFHMIMNPYFKTEEQFLARLTHLFHIEEGTGSAGVDYMDAIERFLFRRAVDEGQTVVLLVDEAQMLPDFALELLRILLNYETNEYKMLQLVLLGQMELLPRISRMANFWDRIAMRYILHPLGLDEVRELIDYRLRQAGYGGSEPLFVGEAIESIWRHTRGYPRKLSMMCHNALEYLVMHDRKRVDVEVAKALIAADVAAADELRREALYGASAAGGQEPMLKVVAG